MPEIEAIINNIDSFYSERTMVKVDELGKPKLDSNGKQKTRTINPSYGRLKIIQKKIQKKIFQDLEIPIYAYGAVKGKDNKRNARRHQGRKYKFTTDLRDFFPSISNKKVYSLFIDEGFSPDVASILTKLTTYKGRIPQGASTSSTLANLVFKKTGNILYEYAKSHNLTFTSFVDDLTFSSPFDFKNLCTEIISIIVDDGYSISHNKTNYSRNPNITGLLVMNNHLKLPESFMQKLKNSNNKMPKQTEGRYRYFESIQKMNYGEKDVTFGSVQ